MQPGAWEKCQQQGRSKEAVQHSRSRPLDSLARPGVGTHRSEQKQTHHRAWPQVLRLLSSSSIINITIYPLTASLRQKHYCVKQC